MTTQVRSAFAVLLLLVMIGVLTVGAAAEDRKVKTQIQPVYPELAKTMHLTGKVKVEVQINAQGAVKNVKVIGGHPVLADAVVKAVERWKYDSGPDETKTIEFNFSGN